jgi:hypothetical protein
VVGQLRSCLLNQLGAACKQEPRARCALLHPTTAARDSRALPVQKDSSQPAWHRLQTWESETSTEDLFASRIIQLEAAMISSACTL